MALERKNTFSPSSLLMNPAPICSLNHFIFPVGMGPPLIILRDMILPCFGFFSPSLLCPGGQGGFDPGETFLEPVLRLRECLLVLGTGTESGVVHPPVHAHLLGLVDRTDDETDLDRQELDVDQVDPDIAGDHNPFVQDPFEKICQIRTFQRVSSALLDCHFSASCYNNFPKGPKSRFKSSHSRPNSRAILAISSDVRIN